MMDADTLTALKGSIAKWHGIVAGQIEDKGFENCPLCKQFIRTLKMAHPNNCDGCPVAKFTGRQYCEGSPYDEYSALKTALEDCDFLNLAETQILQRRMVQVAREELDFLKILLPLGEVA